MAEANHFIIKTMRELSALFESGKYSMDNDSILDRYRQSIEQIHAIARNKASDLLEQIKIYYLSRDIFVDGLRSPAGSSQ